MSASREETKTKILEFERRIAELGLEIEKIKKDFNDVWGIVPYVKGRVEDLEINVDVIILGLSDLKDQISSISGELNSFKKTFFENVEEYNNRLQALKMDLNRIVATIENNKLSNESNLKAMNEDFQKRIDVLKEVIDKCLAQIDLMQKNIDSINGNVKALQKVIEMTDNSALVKQIDVLNSKIVNLNVALEQVKNSIPDNSGLARDISILNSKIQTVQMNLMDVKNDLAEKEKRIALNEIEIEKIKGSTKTSIEEINEKIKEQDEKFIKAKNLDVLATFGLEAKKRINEMEKMKMDTEVMYKSMQKMSYEMNKRMYDFALLKNEFEKIKKDVENLRVLIEKPKVEQYDMGKFLEELKNKIAVTDKTLLEIIEKMKKLEERLALLEISRKTEIPAILE
ncbi:MAG: hypothetical protein QXM38_00865 [Candidatus Aenigmatarchaeota archaeon]